MTVQRKSRAQVELISKERASLKTRDFDRLTVISTVQIPDNIMKYPGICGCRTALGSRQGGNHIR
jgi:hypothetical protein